MSVPEGYYEGKIVAAEAVEGYDGKGVALAFDVEIADGTEIVTCTHAVGGEYADIAPAICRSLGLTWPECIADLSPAVGKPCRVRAKLNQRGTTMNYYITTSRPKKPASADTVQAEIAKLKAAAEDDDNIPF